MSQTSHSQSGGSAPRANGTLRAPERLRRRAEFQAVYDRGARAHGRYFTVCALGGNGASCRLGVAATRRLGSAVRRNRAKRLVRALFRRNKPASVVDIVIIPKPALFEADFRSLEEDYRSTLRRLLQK